MYIWGGDGDGDGLWKPGHDSTCQVQVGNALTDLEVEFIVG